MANIAAIIVAYIPDQKKLLRLIDALFNQVSVIYVVDNTPPGKSSWLNKDSIKTNQSAFRYIPLGKNYGLAYAQNIGINLAANEDFEHIIFFDQDSWIPEKLVSGLIEAENRLISMGEKVGSIGPLFLDEKSGEYSEAILYTNLFVKRIKIYPTDDYPVQSDHIISSGSLIKINTLKEVGYMQESLFIDLVDTEWCLRAANLKYKHFINPCTVMIHNIGDKFVKFGGKSINAHSELRNYYVIRNMTYLMLYSQASWRWRLNCVYKIPRYAWIFICLAPSENKFKVASMLLRAFLYGLSARMGE